MIVRPICALALVALVTAACTGPGGSAPPVSVAPAASSAPSDVAGGCPTEQPTPLPAGETRTVAITTDLGAMTLKIEADLSPIATGNFVALAECDFYDDVAFHRVVPGFVIQGGDPTGTGGGGPGYTIEDESVKATYRRGVVAMARTEQPNSVGSQFFIVLDEAAAAQSLTPVNTYQIIGSVTSGMEVADAITAAAGGVQLPPNPVVMTDVTVSNP